ncbi:MAG: 50S ribosomal protein L13 [Candidatus Margulisbacteria bacterium]|nr:50S ribosomal protein L13 [Candidatus Margulisiibacteriota bacterium]
MKKNKTKYEKKETVKRDWYLVDVSGKVLGKFAVKLATYLRGKHKAIYTPHVDCGDYIVVINADKLVVTGKKMEQKIYFTHSGYPGGKKLLSLEEMMQRKPEKVVQLAVAGMLPKSKLGRKMLTKLKVYAGSAHPHKAQKLQKLEV